MNIKTLLSVVSVIFAVIAVLHLARIVYGWPSIIGSFEVPMWLSWIAVAAAGYLSYEACRISRGK